MKTLCQETERDWINEAETLLNSLAEHRFDALIVRRMSLLRPFQQLIAIIAQFVYGRDTLILLLETEDRLVYRLWNPLVFLRRNQGAN